MRVALILSGMATNLPGLRVPLSSGLRLATPPSLLKPPMFLILKSPDFSRKELLVRLAGYKESMLVHILRYLNLREVLTNGVHS